MNDRASEVTIELAKELIAAMQAHVPTWSKAFVRFSATDEQFGSNGSYVTDAGVFLLDPFKLQSFFEKFNALGSELREVLSKKNGSTFCVLLLSVDSSFDYKIDFEHKDMNKWKITKMNGASGLPEGVHNA